MNILMVEDSQLIARALTRLLKKRGHTVIHVQGIQDAKMALEQTPVDVVVTDRDVVDGDAWEWALRCGKRVVYMSGRPNIDHPYEYFTKGDDSNKLIDMVEYEPSSFETDG